VSGGAYFIGEEPPELLRRQRDSMHDMSMRLQGVVATVRRLHGPDPYGNCSECSNFDRAVPHPCLTRRVVDGESTS